MANGRLQVAIVDDDGSVRRALARLLKAWRFDASTFESGRMFLDSLAEQRPDCVVLDLHMPGMNGIDVLAALADAGLCLPIVMISGHSTPEWRDRCLAAGARAYLSKPLDEIAFLQAVGDAAAAASRH